MTKSIDKIIKKSHDPRLIESAFEFAKEAYKDKKRLSGENYIEHAVRVAAFLDEMGLDSTTIAFALLHDTLDDLPDLAKGVQLKAIEKKFGPQIASLVEKITNVNKIRYSLFAAIKDKKSLTRDKLENIRKMFLALAGDLRAVLVELVSRLDGLNFLQDLPEDKRKLYALETLQVFVPVANRLGLSQIKRRLEDNAFAHLFPDKFNWLEKNIKERYEEREKFLKKFIPHLNKIFKKERVKILDINYRAKSYWSTYQKLVRHDMDFEKIHDLIALRVIAPDIESCYKILGVLHKHFKPLSDEINDYIAKPKINGYRSLHTTVTTNDKITEIQIRTEAMHKEAEYGVCAHWSYKEKIDLQKEGQNFEWMRGAENFWKTFKINFFTNQVFTFTPRGDILILPKDSTPVDFAYAVHSDIGNHCESAKIGGKIVQLNTILKNGDIVEITVNKNKKPSKDWLRFVKTSLARGHIKKLTEQEESKFKLPIPSFIRKTLTEITERATGKKKPAEQPRRIYLAGQKGILIHLAKCCDPQPGDKVKAFIAKNRAAVLHRSSCSNFKKIAEKFPDKIIDADWGQ